MIIEGLLTSCNSDGQVNVAPMGPIVHGNFERLTLRPFAGSTTFENLMATRTAVFHIVDRVNVIAEAAVRRLTQLPDTEPAASVQGVVLNDCCRWFELKITDVDTTDARSVMSARVVHEGRRKEFNGFNRARHAVIETAILATRIHLLPPSEIEHQLPFLASAVNKTAGPEEEAAFRLLLDYMKDAGVSVP